MKYRVIAYCIGATLMLLSGCKKEEETPYVIERGTVTDIDGNVYETVKIGDQWWMAENLRASHFNDGTPLQYVPMTMAFDTAWALADSASYCFINDSIFGKLYNAYVMNGPKNIAPVGWHVPTDEEWMELEETLGMTGEEVRQTGWRGTEEANLLASQYNRGWPANDQNEGLYGSDFYGFNALPSGVRGHDGRTNTQSNSAWWWCKSTLNGENYYRTIDTYHQRIFRQLTLPAYGMSIRCIKD